MIILDTDIISILDFDQGHARDNLIARLSARSADDICTTIISLEEQMRGWMSYIAASKTLERQVEGYRQLHRLFRAYGQRPVLDFDDAAASFFQQFKRSRIRIGSMDLKIAAIALANQALVISRNLADFRCVPKLLVEDWTRTA